MESGVWPVTLVSNTLHTGRNRGQLQMNEEKCRQCKRTDDTLLEDD